MRNLFFSPNLKRGGEISILFAIAIVAAAAYLAGFICANVLLKTGHNTQSANLLASLLVVLLVWRSVIALGVGAGLPALAVGIGAAILFEGFFFPHRNPVNGYGLVLCGLWVMVRAYSIGPPRKQYRWPTQ